MRHTLGMHALSFLWLRICTMNAELASKFSFSFKIITFIRVKRIPTFGAKTETYEHFVEISRRPWSAMLLKHREVK